MTGRPWHRALALALVGADLDLGVQERPDADALARELAAHGYPAERVREIAAGASPWPFPLPETVRAGLGAAQLFAALRDARRVLGVDSLATRRPSTRTTLDADERRLSAEAPPHHGV